MFEGAMVVLKDTKNTLVLRTTADRADSRLSSPDDSISPRNNRKGRMILVIHSKVSYAIEFAFVVQLEQNFLHCHKIDV